MDPGVSGGAGVPDPQGLIHPSPPRTGCGVYSQLAGHDLVPEEIKMKSRSEEMEH